MYTIIDNTISIGSYVDKDRKNNSSVFEKDYCLILRQLNYVSKYIQKPYKVYLTDTKRRN